MSSQYCFENHQSGLAVFWRFLKIISEQDMSALTTYALRPRPKKNDDAGATFERPSAGVTVGDPSAGVLSAVSSSSAVSVPPRTVPKRFQTAKNLQDWMNARINRKTNVTLPSGQTARRRNRPGRGRRHFLSPTKYQYQGQKRECFSLIPSASRHYKSECFC